MLKDEFSDQKISPQRRYQLRHARDGLCEKCSQPAVMSGVCLKHAIKAREYQHKHRNCKRRLNSKSYRLEKEQTK